jgi:hypothetical protein
MSHMLLIDNYSYEIGPLIRHGYDAGQCLVYAPHRNESFCVRISDAELLTAANVHEALVRAVTACIRRNFGGGFQQAKG